MNNIKALAYEEVQRLLEKCFSFHNPYTCIIETDIYGIPFNQKEEFCRLVEKELLEKGEKISREGEYFKIDKFQRK